MNPQSNSNAPNQKLIVNVEHLWFAYKKNQWILEDVNFNIHPGEIIALAGKSGIGKTTLGFILKGLIPHAIKGILKGKVSICEKKVKKTKISDLARDVGMVFQNLNTQLFSPTVIDEIEFGLHNLKLNPDWADEALEYLGIRDLKKRMPMNLSAGQKQRVVLASIIATHPKVLILDEPTAHLDLDSKIGLRDWLIKLNRELGTTIIIIEQNPWLIGELCKDILHVHDQTVTRLRREDLLEKLPNWSWK